MFLDDLRNAAFNQCGLTREQPLLVGVSGGADSLALMFGLETLGFCLKIAHLDHGIRVESNLDADFIEELAQSRGLAFVRERIDVGKVAESEGQSIEEAARHVRYKFLFEQARLASAQAVAVGHNADDQVETVLMHFLRGSAMPGLTGMSFRSFFPIWDDNLPLVRPLLGVWREEIDAFLGELGISPRIDCTNRDVTYFRNKLRHKLIPYLEDYNPNIRKVLWRMSDVLREENEFFVAQVKKAWDDCCVRQNENQVILYRSRFLLLPNAIQRRLFRFSISKLRPDLRDVGYDAVERGIEYIIDPSQSNEQDLVAKLNLAIIEDYIIIKTWESDLLDWQMPLIRSQHTEALIEIDKPTALRHGWCLETEILNEIPVDILEKAKELDSYQVLLDYDSLKKPLLLRGRKEGDRWQPLGMPNQNQKLKDFFINEKIPKHLRNIWPLVCSGGEIAWVVGLRPSEAYKITKKTKQILHLRLVRKIA